MATVGQGSDSRRARMAWAALTIASASAASLRATNSLTSAPAMNPPALADRITTPRGGDAASARRCVSNSSSVARDRTLVDVPGLSNESQAIPSTSSRAQAAAASFITRDSCHGRLQSRGAEDIEVAEDGPVIGEADVG